MRYTSIDWKNGSTQALIDLAREESAKIAGDSGQAGVSQLKSITVVRYLGNSSEAARRIMLRTWGCSVRKFSAAPQLYPGCGAHEWR